MSIDKPKMEKSGSAEITRRDFLKTLIGGAAGALCFGLEKSLAQETEIPSRYGKDGWFFTPEKMKEIYEQEYGGDKILKNHVLKKEGKWFGVFDDREFDVPEEFLTASLAHLKNMLEQKAAQYLFRLDAFHGHLFIPEDKHSKYASLKAFDEARLLVEDKNIGVLYHNNEHLKEDTGRESREVFQKRNVVGWYDGRPIEILPMPTKTKRTAADTLGHDLSPWLKFAANENGEFSIVMDDKETRLDFSFDDNDYF